MNVSEKQTVEIVKVLYRGVNILILDEPTAVLTPQEAERLFRVMWRMRNDGKSLIIITHKMHEVKEISDRVVVLRKGQYIGEMNTEDSDIQEMTNMMVGRSVTLNIERKTPVNPMPKIEIEHLTILDEDGVPKIQDVSFTARFSVLPVYKDLDRKIYWRRLRDFRKSNPGIFTMWRKTEAKPI